MADLRHQISVAAQPKAVYDALTSTKGLSSWWTADASADVKVGGKAEFGFGNRRTVFRMTIDELTSGKRVVWSCHGDPEDWQGTILTWDLTSHEESTVVRFSHSGWKETNEMYAICNSSWGELMHRLKDYVEGRNPGPHWKE
jgi:uncharacterized protein YndB with AHSA1/START domain